MKHSRRTKSSHRTNKRTAATTRPDQTLERVEDILKLITAALFAEHAQEAAFDAGDFFGAHDLGHGKRSALEAAKDRAQALVDLCRA